MLNSSSERAGNILREPKHRSSWQKLKFHVIGSCNINKFSWGDFHVVAGSSTTRTMVLGGIRQGGAPVLEISSR